MEPRYSPRIPVKAPVFFAANATRGEGHILDLTVPGCLIESPVSVKKGDYVQLKIELPGLKCPLSVSLGAVRWTNGKLFGVEFIKMGEKDRRELHQMVMQHRTYAAPIAQTNRKQFSDPGGSNWHLETYSEIKR